MESLKNPAQKNELIDENGLDQPPIDLYDDLPPANPARLNRLGAALAALLLNEVNETLQDVTKALAFLRELENNSSPRKTVSGETIPSSLAENLAQTLKRNGVNEAVREQLYRLQEQAGPVWATVEANLHQYWLALRERSQQLRLSIKSEKGLQPEAYQPQGNAPSQPYSINAVAPNFPPLPEVEVAPARPRSHELRIDIFDEPASGEIVLIAEHPGLQPNSIHVSLAHDILTLVAIDTTDQYYTRECLLPRPVEAANFTQKYRNGVLEIRLKTLES